MPANEEPTASRRFEATTMRGKTVVSVTSAGLTVGEKPGDVYSFDDAVLGPWTIGNVDLLQGLALHLRCGRNRLVLGGVDYRVPTRTPLEAPPVDVTLDTWVPAPDFAEILTLVARRRGWDARPEPGKPTRCLLIPNTSKGWDVAGWPGQDFIRRRKHRKVSSLAIDIGNGAIWVIDRATNAVIASASVRQVRATPKNYSGHPSGISEAISGILWALEEWERPPKGATAVLAVDIPGSQPLIIACPRHFRAPASRFDWVGEVPREHGLIPNYLVSGADWLTLAETFGLASRLEDNYNL